MAPDISGLLAELRPILDGPVERSEKARRVAKLIRQAGGYRWVGLYAVGSETIGVIGWDGPGAPTHPIFPLTQGLNGAAVPSGEPVIGPDVTRDSRYLPTLSSTRTEMIMPIRTGPGGAVLGTTDVESDRVDPFSERDRELLSTCAGALVQLWTGAA